VVMAAVMASTLLHGMLSDSITACMSSDDCNSSRSVAVAGVAAAGAAVAVHTAAVAL
jgi:hypothetical protein